MKNECSIVRDLLPLYVDEMLFAESAAFVKEHLEECGECRAELEKLKASDKPLIDTPKSTDEPMKAISKKIKRISRTALICFIAIFVLIGYFGAVVVSADKFSTWTPVSSFAGYIMVTYLGFDYVVIQQFPKVVITADNDAFFKYMSDRGYHEVEGSQLGASYTFTNGEETVHIMTTGQFSKIGYTRTWQWRLE